MSGILHDLRVHQKFISNVTEGVQAERVNEL
jgi:hypothetical protein